VRGLSSDLVVAKQQEQPEVRAMRSISPLSLVRNGKVDQTPVSSADAKAEFMERARTVVTSVDELATQIEIPAFKDVEKRLFDDVMALARLAVVLFLTLCEERSAARAVPGVQEVGGRRFRRAPAQARNLSTLFGVVRYWRGYMREVTDDAADKCRGFHPLDIALGLTADRFTFNVLSRVVRLATRLSFAEARMVSSWFMPVPPATEVIEQAVLGMGRHTQEWFEIRPAPDGDGDVLVTMLDSKGAPTATAEELARRRGKRRKKPAGLSPRHRGRNRRKRHGKKPRRKKGDKSKNAKMATMFVQFTLRREGRKLLGPINVRRYASFGPKEHAFVVARREADKRGFTAASGKVHQIVTDGDPDLACYAKRHFPEAIHTIDVMHVIEKLWTAGECLYPEGSDELRRWVEEQRDRLFRGKVADIVREIQRRRDAIPVTGPGNKGRRERLHDVHRYLDKRLAQLNYDELLAQDLEIGSGMIEGAVKNVIGKRCDHGGMRWIKERAEAVLQLRCIELNGDWEEFIAWLHDKTRARGQRAERVRLQQSTAAPLPAVMQAA
jgi:hypothetical protein